MNLVILNPKKSLNKAFLKQRPLRSEIDLFKENLIRLLNKVDEIEREENQKNHIRDLLRDTWYKETNEINTKDTKDLVIHSGKTNKDKVNVIIEAKRPGNKTEMISEERPNAKALHELVLYYLRERVEENNIDIKYLIATNVYEWYIFDSSFFEKIFYRNKAFVKQYEEWRDGKKVTKDTNLFYNEIAKPFIDHLEEEIPCTYFDIRDYEQFLRNKNEEDDKNLIALQKLLSPHFLLRIPFASDSNSLDEKFYRELLYIIGLEEVKEGSKTIIRRREKDRQPGSLIENAINILTTEDALRKVKDKTLYGQTGDEQLFGVALELSLTWINRLLFLKLLEGQLVAYHKGEVGYRFLNSEMIKDYDELYKLFHQVLARDIPERNDSIQQKYSRVPYLNSSLFEISELEDTSIKINSLDNSETLRIFNTTVLTEEKNKHTHLPALDYLFRFFDAFDFASEGKEDIQEDSKTLINASVLGKVFEKINGYKEGSVFTPGFITMYMCHKSIRLAVVQKFRGVYGWNIDRFEDIKNYLADRRTAKDILEFNTVVNSLRICDIAVGSGHFLVSALNELIAIKFDLGLLADSTGTRFRDFEITIENDELIVTDNAGDIFEYRLQNGKPANKEMQRLQETLFHEKQTLIENCLFGVDINPNSVKICRLRLWIELLKNAYYRGVETHGGASLHPELQTLPNIDINIKCGNSLISRYPLDANLKTALRKSKWSIDSYRLAVSTYRSTKSKDVKREMENLILKIKQDFTSEIRNNDPIKTRLDKLANELYNRFTGNFLFESEAPYGKSEKELALKRRKEQEKLEKEIKALTSKIEEIKTNKIYEKAFEWRFEFPEVLDDDGNFTGYDIVLGNPPYISAIDLKKSLEEASYMLLKQNYETAKGTVDLFVYFFEKGIRLLKNHGQLNFITPNRYLSASYGETLREFLYKNTQINEIVDYSHIKVFKKTSTYPVITFLTKTKKEKSNYSLKIGKYDDETSEINYKIVDSKRLNFLEGYIWGYLLNDKILITEKIIKQSVPITESASINATSTAAEADLFHDLINETSGFKLINTGTIDRFESLWGKISLTDKGKKYLTPYLPQTNEKISTSRNILYKSPKIIIAKIALTVEAFYDSNGEFASINTNCFHSFKNGYDPKFILAWLNSKLFQFTFECFFEGLKMQGGYLPFSAPYLSKMFIKRLIDNEQKPFIALVDQVLLFKQEGLDTTDLEKQIDQMIYQLYDLTEEEIRIVEGN